MEATNKKDFVELEFVGLANSEIFDTNIKERMKELNPNIKEKELAGLKPFVVCVGQEMLVKGFDEALEGKEVGKQYKVELPPGKAFGRRDPKLVKTMPLRVFTEKNIQPRSGMVFYLDNFLVRIISVSGGRISVDFNNPLAGKTIEYEFKILKKIDKEEDKINSLMGFFLKKRFKFDIETSKIIIEAEKNFVKFIEMYKDKFKEILGKEIEVKEVAVKLEEKKERQAEKKKNESEESEKTESEKK